MAEKQQGEHRMPATGCQSSPGRRSSSEELCTQHGQPMRRCLDYGKAHVIPDERQRPWDEHDEAVLRVVGAARVTDDLDYTGLFEYEDETA